MHNHSLCGKKVLLRGLNEVVTFRVEIELSLCLNVNLSDIHTYILLTLYPLRGSRYSSETPTFY
jgi:hypothetical protein